MAEYYYTPGQQNKNFLSKAVSASKSINNFKIANGYSKPVVVKDYSAGFNGDQKASQHYSYSSKISIDNETINNRNTEKSKYPGQENFGLEFQFHFFYSSNPKKYKVAIY